MTASETECKSRYSFNVSSLLAPFISFGLLTIFSLFAWLMITTHSQAEEFATLRTDSKLLQQAIKQIAENTADIGTLKADVRSIKTDVGSLKTDVGSLKADVSILTADVSGLRNDVDQISKVMNARFAEYDQYFVKIIDWIETRPQTSNNEYRDNTLGMAN